MSRTVYDIIKHPVTPPLVLFLLAFGLRLALIITARDFPLFQVPIMDMLYHDEWARAIAAGNFWGDEAFFRAPLYPYFLALLYAISGGSITFARVVQAVIGGGSAVVCYFVGLELFRNRKIAFTGAALLATIWTAVYFDIELLLIVLEVFLDLLAVLFLLRARDGRVRNFVLAGLFVGLSAITRPNILVFASFVWLIYIVAQPRLEKRKLIKGLVTFYIIVIAVITPVTARNYIVGDDLVLISSQGGLNLYIGNNPESDGSTAIVPGTRGSWWGGIYDATTLAEVEEGRDLKPSEIDGYYLRKAFAFFKDEPVKAVKLLLRKAYLFTNAVELGNNFDNNLLKLRLAILKFDPVGIYIVLPFAFLGIGVHIKDFRKYTPAYLFVVIYSATVVLFFVNDKFRMPVVPFFCLFAAAGFFWLIKKARLKEWKPFTIAFVILATLFVYCWIPPKGYSKDKNLAQAGATVGMLYQQLGRYDDAEKEISEALTRDPHNSTALVFMGNLYMETGREDEAATFYEKTLVIDPNDIKALTNLGIYYGEKSDYEKAYAYFERSLEVHPRDGKTLYFYSKALRAGGNRDEAIEKLNLAVAYEYNMKPGYVLLAELAEESGDLDEAERAYEALLDMNPKDPVGTLGLAQILHKKGDYAGAETYYRRYLDDYGSTVVDVDVIKYNLACCLALQGKRDEAIEILTGLVNEDPDRFKEYAANDPELTSLHNDSEFTNLIER